jgi:Tfp pilus assembly protein PilV
MTRPDAGESLVELLVTVVVLGIAGAGIAAALLTADSAAGQHRQQAAAQNLLRTWAEQVAAGPYTDCATAARIAAPAAALPAGTTATVASVQYWNGTAFTSTCGTDSGIQRVTLRVTSTASRTPAVTEDVAVVLRKPCVSTC